MLLNYNQADTDKTELDPFKLRFTEASTEAEYNRYQMPSLLQEVRAGFIYAIISWLLYLVYEPLLTNTAIYSVLAFVSMGVLLTALASYSTLTTLFNRHHQAILAVYALATAVCLTVKVNLYPDYSLDHYFPIFPLLLIWVTSSIGLRFWNGLIFGVLLAVSFYIVLFSVAGTPFETRVSGTYFLFMALMIGASIAYFREIHRRQAFLTHRMLEQQNIVNMERVLRDSLTGLPNRELLFDRLEHAIAVAKRNTLVNAGIFIDLDNFKRVNDTFGHQMGDVYLQETARRLQMSLRNSDTVARISGDEFFIILADVKSKDTAFYVMTKVLEALKLPLYTQEGKTLEGILASAGICIFPYEGCHAMDIVSRADAAMYQGKRRKSKKIHFSE